MTGLANREPGHVPSPQSLRNWLETVTNDDLADMLKLEGRVARFAEVLKRENLTREYAAEYLRLRLDICRSGGQLLAAMPKAGNNRQPDSLSGCLGVESDAAAQQIASRWQRIAGIPDDLFYEYHDLDEPSVAGALRVATTGRLDPLMSSRTTEWETPAELFALLDDEFGFELDVCATALNAKCDRWFGIADDGLAQEWRGTCWMNPPYGTGIGAWMAKAYESAQAGATVVCLIPARTDTTWWWDYARRGELRFLRGRLRFNDGDAAPFPSAITILGRRVRVVWWEAWLP